MMTEEYLDYKIKEISRRLKVADEKANCTSTYEQILMAHKRDHDSTPEQFKQALSDLKASRRLQTIKEDTEEELLLLTDLMPEAYREWTYGHTEKRVGYVRRLLAKAKQTIGGKSDE